MVQNLGGQRQNRWVISAILFHSGGSRGLGGASPPPSPPRPPFCIALWQCFKLKIAKFWNICMSAVFYASGREDCSDCEPLDRLGVLEHPQHPFARGLNAKCTRNVFPREKWKIILQASKTPAKTSRFLQKNIMWRYYFEVSRGHWLPCPFCWRPCS